jgi:hypothetical protein
MDWKKFKKIFSDKKYRLRLSILLLLFFACLALLFFGPQLISEPMPPGVPQGCGIEYGAFKCVNGRAAVPFFNPNKAEITSLTMSIPVKSGTDIFDVNFPLGPQEPGTVTASNCNDIISGTFSLRWCCSAQCFDWKDAAPNPDIVFS